MYHDTDREERSSMIEMTEAEYDTGLNNLMVHSISDVQFNEFFGFTDAEVREMLCDYGIEDHYTEAREWYDGYRFGGQDVYCPWDVINYCYALRNDPQAEPKSDGCFLCAPIAGAAVGK